MYFYHIQMHLTTSYSFYTARAVDTCVRKYGRYKCIYRNISTIAFEMLLLKDNNIIDIFITCPIYHTISLDVCSCRISIGKWNMRLGILYRKKYKIINSRFYSHSMFTVVNQIFTYKNEYAFIYKIFLCI